MRTDTQRRAQPHRAAERMRGSRGATLVEYGVVVALFVVAAMGGVRALNSAGQATTNSAADCVSRRPPPASCQPRLVTTSTAVTVVPTTTTTAPTTTTTTAQAVVTVRSSSGVRDGTTDYWFVNVEYQVYRSDASNAPVRGAQVLARILVRVPAGTGQEFFASCTTESNGRCTATVLLPYTDIMSVRVVTEEVVSDPAARTPLPEVAQVNRPW